MARSIHPQYSAAERYERRQARRPRPIGRRATTRAAIVAAALAEEA